MRVQLKSSSICGPKVRLSFVTGKLITCALSSLKILYSHYKNPNYAYLAIHFLCRRQKGALFVLKIGGEIAQIETWHGATLMNRPQIILVTTMCYKIGGRSIEDVDKQTLENRFQKLRGAGII